MPSVDYLVIEQRDGWWVMMEDSGKGPYATRELAEAQVKRPLRGKPRVTSALRQRPELEVRA